MHEERVRNSSPASGLPIPAVSGPYPAACIAYQVRGSLGTGDGKVAIHWQLVSPETVFSAVDRPFWERLARMGLFEGEMGEATRYPSWLKWAEDNKAALPPGEERQRAWRTLRHALLGQEVDEHKWLTFAQAMRGRLLLLDETIKIAASYFSEETDILEGLQWGFLQGYFNWQPAILPAPSGWFRRLWEGRGTVYRCGRCGLAGALMVYCQRCGLKECAYCPHCIALGRVFACQPLLVWENLDQEGLGRLPGKGEGVEVHWEGDLSPWQKKASQALVRFAQQEKEDRFLVWAVCGAGKTEMLFDLIQSVLSQGKRVLIASPRRDVILELSPRLKGAFPAVSLSTLFGGSGERFKPAQLVLATTHQVLRFSRCFDLIVIDEEDAFPFQADPMLPYAVERALAPGGKLVYLSATPRPELKKKALRRELPHILIPQRFHGHPLAVPRIRPVGRWRKKMEQKEVITPLAEFVRHLIIAGRCAYLFVPRVRDIPLVCTYVQEVLLPWEGSLPAGTLSQGDRKDMREAGFTVEGVHAQDPRRDEIVRRFRQQGIRLLVTTTILERGVTIPYCDAAVLGADDPIFDSAALIQMAGRVGRKKEDPEGLVWFLPEVRTRSQVEAIRQIETWNRWR